jgi:hypothetical protein
MSESLSFTLEAVSVRWRFTHRLALTNLSAFPNLTLSIRGKSFVNARKTDLPRVNWRQISLSLKIP